MNTHQPSLTFLFDVDNTLLDNDGFERDWSTWLDEEIGPGSAKRYWEAFEAQHAKRDYADFLGSLQRCWEVAGRDPRWLGASGFLLDYPFEKRLYPGALEVLARVKHCADVWLITDGDGVFQPHKLHRAGLWDAVSGRVRIYVHKEQMLSDIQRACGADHYIMVDDKRRILNAIKRQWHERVTTIQPLQGHYAQEPAIGDDDTPPDLKVKHIGMLMQDDFALLRTLRTP
jgi:FMN phosphatase YigB (HAD superfamily)